MPQSAMALALEPVNATAGLPESCAGWMEKKGRLKASGQTWKRRYFVLRGHFLLCSDGPDAADVLAAIDVVKVECAGPVGDDDATVLNLMVLEGSIKLRAPTVEDRERWLAAIEIAQNGTPHSLRRRMSRESGLSLRDALEGAKPGGQDQRLSIEDMGRLSRGVSMYGPDDLTLSSGEDKPKTKRRSLIGKVLKTLAAPLKRLQPKSPPQQSPPHAQPESESEPEVSRTPESPKPREVTTPLPFTLPKPYAPHVPKPRTPPKHSNSFVQPMPYVYEPHSPKPLAPAEPPPLAPLAPPEPPAPPVPLATPEPPLAPPELSPVAAPVSPAPAPVPSLARPAPSPSLARPALSPVLRPAPSPLAREASSVFTPGADAGKTEWREAEALRWVEGLLSAKLASGTGDLWDWLASGEVLCDVANAVGAAADAAPPVGRVHRGAQPAFKAIENISSFLAACRSLGVSESSLFESNDLFERRGLPQVLHALHALKVWTPEIAAKRRAAPPKAFSPVPSMFGRRAAPPPFALDPAYVPTAAAVDAASAGALDDDGLATVVAEYDALAADELTVFVGDVVAVKLARGAWSCTDAGDGGWALVQKGEAQGLVPTACLQGGVTAAACLKAGSRGDSGEDRALAAKAAAKYDPIAEALAQHWVEQVTGHVFRGAFGVELKDGVLLCRLVNEISAGAAPEPYVGRTEFRQMQNVSNFLAAARRFGVAPHDSFDTIDLFELKDLTGVVHCLAALSKAIQTSALNFTGPYLTGQHTVGFEDAVHSNLRVIVAVGEYRDRNRHVSGDGAAAPADGDAAERVADVISEAVEYRLAMLGLRDAASAGAHVSGVDRASMEPAFLVLWSTSTKHTQKTESDERRVVHLLACKKVRFEMVYVDVSPERKVELAAITRNAQVVLPALTFGASYHGDTEALQMLEDDGRLDPLLAEAQPGEGFWALPEAWGATSSMLEGGGLQLINGLPF